MSDEIDDAALDDGDSIRTELEELRLGMAAIDKEIDLLRQRVSELEGRQDQAGLGIIRAVFWLLFILVPTAGAAFLIYYIVFGL